MLACPCPYAIGKATKYSTLYRLPPCKYLTPRLGTAPSQNPAPGPRRRQMLSEDDKCEGGVMLTWDAARCAFTVRASARSF